jgi:hypothetical protein
MGRFLGVAAISCLVLTAPAAHASPNPGGFWLSVSAQYRTGSFLREWSGFLALSIPFDQFAAPRVMRDEQRLTEEPPKKEGEATPAPPEPAPKLELPEPLLTPRLARGAVRHALAVAGYLDTRGRLSSLSARARSSAALPELRLRTLHSAGQTLRLTPTSDDPYRYTQAGTSELALEARLTWHFDRLVFANEEVSIERLQHERDAAERRLIDYVLQRLVSWQRSRARTADPDLEPAVRQTAELEAIGAAVELDVLTDGWFSQAIGESDGGLVAGAGEPAKVEVDTPRHAR